MPIVARGFTVTTPNSDVVDLGTEFGLTVDGSGETEVHVFDGLVEAHSLNDKAAKPVSLYAGDALSMASQRIDKWRPMHAAESRFTDLSAIENIKAEELQALAQKWLRQRDMALADPRLVAYYDFQKPLKKKRRLTNKALTGKQFDGAIVGAPWVDGPWPGKQALNFKRPGDRVRIKIDREFTDITLAAWVRIDSLDRRFNSLLLTDGFDPGEIHWQINQTGQLNAGLRHVNTKGRDYLSETLFEPSDTGRWYHMATRISQQDGYLTHFVNGIAIKKIPLNETGMPYHIGQASIGNWQFDEKPNKKRGAHAVRNINGSIAELMIFDAALDAAEIAQLSLN